MGEKWLSSSAGCALGDFLSFTTVTCQNVQYGPSEILSITAKSDCATLTFISDCMISDVHDSSDWALTCKIEILQHKLMLIFTVSGVYHAW